MNTHLPRKHRRRPLALSACLVVLLAGCGSGSTAGTPGARGGRLEAAEALDFGTVELGERAERTLTLRNVGRGSLEVEGLEAPAPFGAGEGLPATVEAGETLDVTVAFAPEAPGPAAATARVRAGGATAEVRLSGSGGSFSLVCEPTAIDLGRPVVGTTRPFGIGCRNDSLRDLVVRVEGPPGVSWVPAEPVTVASGTAMVFELEYRPTGLAPLAGSVRFMAGAATVAEVPVTADPIATAVGPVAGLECPAGLDLGFTPPGTTAGRTFRLANVGDRPLRVEAVEVEGPFAFWPAPPFELPADDPATAEDEGSLELTVRFTPTAVGNVSGTVRLSFDDPGTPEWIGCVAGVGGGPVLSCSPSSLDFGPVASALPRTERITCTNAGTDVPGTDDDRLHLRSVVAHGDRFTADADLPSAGLGPGETVALDVTFTPTASGPAVGTLAIESDDPASPHLELPLAAAGILAGPCAYQADPVLHFGKVVTGRPATLSASIRNTGTEPCVIRDVALAPGGSPEFSLPDGPIESAVIAPGSTLRVPVRFSAAAGAGRQEATLAFAISNPETPATVVSVDASSGEESECLRIFPIEVNFGDVSPGCGSLTAELTVVPVCGPASPLPSFTVEPTGAAGAFSWHLPDASSAAWRYTFTVSFRPTEPGEAFAGVRIVGPDGEGRLLPIRGRGATSGTETFAATPDLDLLIVSQDYSFPDARTVRQAVPAILAVAAGGAIDYRAGVTGSSTDGSAGRVLPIDGSRPRIVRPSTPDAENVLAANVPGEFSGSGYRLADAAFLALTPPLVDHADDPRHPEPNDGNLGLVREAARLAVLVATNAMDWSSTPGVVERLAEFKGEGWRDSRLQFHALEFLGHGGYCHGGDGGYPWWAAQTTGGATVAICDGTLDPAVWDRLGRAIFFRTRFLLRGVPADQNGDGAITSGDVQVLVGGRAWAGGWTFDAAANALDFDPEYPPDPHEDVEVRYAPRCLPQGE